LITGSAIIYAGGGGGGGTTGEGQGSQAGGSGVVIVSWVTANFGANTCAGATPTINGANTYCKFDSVGNWTFTLVSLPTPTPTPTPQPDPNTTLLESILSESQSIQGILDSVLAFLTSNLNDLLSGIKLQIDKLSFDEDSFLKVTGKLSSTWEIGTAEGHGFLVTTDVATLSTKNETSVLLIQNPLSSGKTMRLNKLLIGTSSQQSNTLRIYRNPLVASTGTARDINALNTGGSSVMQAFKFPTISTKGSELDSLIISSSGREIDYGLGFYIQPGESVLMTLQASVVNSDNTISVDWLEE